MKALDKIIKCKDNWYAPDPFYLLAKDLILQIIGDISYGWRSQLLKEILFSLVIVYVTITYPLFSVLIEFKYALVVNWV